MLVATMKWRRSSMAEMDVFVHWVSLKKAKAKGVMRLLSFLRCEIAAIVFWRLDLWWVLWVSGVVWGVGSREFSCIHLCS